MTSTSFSQISSVNEPLRSRERLDVSTSLSTRWRESAYRICPWLPYPSEPHALRVPAVRWGLRSHSQLRRLWDLAHWTARMFEATPLKGTLSSAANRANADQYANGPSSSDGYADTDGDVHTNPNTDRDQYTATAAHGHAYAHQLATARRVTTRLKSMRIRLRCSM